MAHLSHDAQELSAPLPQSQRDSSVEPVSSTPSLLHLVHRQTDPFTLYETLPRPLYRDEALQCWVVTSYRAVEKVLTETQLFGSAHPRLNQENNARHLSIMNAVNLLLDQQVTYLDTEEHERIKQILLPFFRSKAQLALGQHIQRVVDRLLEKQRNATTFDVVKDFAAPLPLLIAAHLLGLSSDDSSLARYTKWNTAFEAIVTSFHGLTSVPERQEVLYILQEETEAFQSQIAQRRNMTSETLETQTDMISAMVRAGMSDQQIIANSIVLLDGGFRTVPHLIARALYWLQHTPAQLEMVRSQPSLIDDVIKETLRFDGPTHYLARRALVNTEIEGQLVQAGDTLLLLVAAANRDEEQFTHSNVFDSRRTPKKHLSFGYGTHYCWGAGIASLEAKIAVATFLNVFPQFQIASDDTEDTHAWGQELHTRYMLSLPVTVSTQVAQSPQSLPQPPTSQDVKSEPLSPEKSRSGSSSVSPSPTPSTPSLSPASSKETREPVAQSDEASITAKPRLAPPPEQRKVTAKDKRPLLEPRKPVRQDVSVVRQQAGPPHTPTQLSAHAPAQSSDKEEGHRSLQFDPGTTLISIDAAQGLITMTARSSQEQAPLAFTGQHAPETRVPVSGEHEQQIVTDERDLKQEGEEHPRETKESPAPVFMHHLFAEQAERTPHAIAVHLDGRDWSYAFINRAANQCACALQELEVEPETLVALCIERSVDSIIALLAVQKAGGAFLLLDPTQPRETLRFMIEDSGASMILTQGHLLSLFPDFPDKRVIQVDHEIWLRRLAALSHEEPISGVHMGNTAYTTYTPSTSGAAEQLNPVRIVHESLTNLCFAQREVFVLQPHDRVLQFASPRFDTCLFEITLALLSGATLVLGTEQQLHRSDALYHFMEAEHVTVAVLSPTVWMHLPSTALSTLRLVLVVGESCPAELVTRWATQARRVFNLYGPAEYTMWATYAECFPDGGIPSSGHPIPNTLLYIVDEQVRTVATGETGEIAIAGIGLGRYYHRPALNMRQFVRNPFGLHRHERLYLTGNLGRQFADGSLYLLGRKDEKDRKDGSNGTSPQEVRIAKQTDKLTPEMYDHALPEHTSTMHSALPDAPVSPTPTIHEQDSLADIERRLIEQVAGMIHVPAVHIHGEDDFFDLVEDSLDFTQLLLIIEATFQVEIEASDVLRLEYRTLSAISSLVLQALQAHEGTPPDRSHEHNRSMTGETAQAQAATPAATMSSLSSSSSSVQEQRSEPAPLPAQEQVRRQENISLEPEMWVRCFEPRPQAALRLFCFPYAGGEASLFQHWPEALPSHLRHEVELCALQLPGRNNRRKETPLTRFSDLLELLVPADRTRSPLMPYLDKPFVFFGWNVGGHICFELAQRLRMRYQLMPRVLSIAACRAPHLPAPYLHVTEETLDEEVLFQRLQRLHGLSREQLTSEQFRRLFLAQVRADILLEDSYVYVPTEPFECPIVVFGGIDDPLVHSSDLAAWQQETRQGLRLSMLPGDHFFVRQNAPVILHTLFENVPLQTGTGAKTPSGKLSVSTASVASPGNTGARVALNRQHYRRTQPLHHSRGETREDMKSKKISQ